MKKIFQKITVCVSLFSVALCSGAANAHQIWIEQDAGGARLYFGEFHVNLREVSPGLLDRFGRLSARRVAGTAERPLTLKKGRDAYRLSGRAGAGQSLIAEDKQYRLFEYEEDGKKIRGIWTPAARFITDFRARAPKLTLDIVPTGKAGEFQVFYKNKPLPEAEVHIKAPSGWGLERETDKWGKFSFTTPWKGFYVVEVGHDDKTPGTRTTAKGAENYDRASFVTSLSFMQSRGYTSPPAPPKAKPN